MSPIHFLAEDFDAQFMEPTPNIVHDSVGPDVCETKFYLQAANEVFCSAGCSNCRRMLLLNGHMQQAAAVLRLQLGCLQGNKLLSCRQRAITQLEAVVSAAIHAKSQ